MSKALSEVLRVLVKGGKFYVGLPCEGGFIWNFGRRLTSQRHFSKKYNIDYSRIIKIEHCNSCEKVIGELSRMFYIRRKKYYPFPLLKTANLNLTAMLIAEKE